VVRCHYMPEVATGVQGMSSGMTPGSRPASGVATCHGMRCRSSSSRLRISKRWAYNSSPSQQTCDTV
jgi:hypothetical protein